MLRLLFVAIGNILLLPINIILLPIRLIYKVVIDNRAKLWIVAGGSRVPA